MNGSILQVVGSGIRSMSLALIAFHPLMLEPSNPRPFSKKFLSTSSTGMVKCCHEPIKSRNLRSTNSTS